MGTYRTMTAENITAPRQATTADIWITANIFGPWSSGAAQFDDFAVTTTAPWPWRNIYIGGGTCAGVAAIAAVGFFMRRRKKQRGA
jgi:hypothetical protein